MLVVRKADIRRNMRGTSALKRSRRRGHDETLSPGLADMTTGQIHGGIITDLELQLLTLSSHLKTTSDPLGEFGFWWYEPCLSSSKVPSNNPASKIPQP